MITFDLISEVLTAANCHFTMYNVKYVLLDYIRASYSVFNMLVGSRDDLGCLMTQVLVMMFRTVIISFIEKHGDDFCTRKRTRKRQPAIEDVWATTWGCMLKHRDIVNSYSFKERNSGDGLEVHTYYFVIGWSLYVEKETFLVQQVAMILLSLKFL